MTAVNSAETKSHSNVPHINLVKKQARGSTSESNFYGEGGGGGNGMIVNKN